MLLIPVLATIVATVLVVVSVGTLLLQTAEKHVAYPYISAVAVVLSVLVTSAGFMAFVGEQGFLYRLVLTTARMVNLLAVAVAMGLVVYSIYEITFTDGGVKSKTVTGLFCVPLFVAFLFVLRVPIV